jgi:predicted RNase H-like HicB family nuclease
MREKFTATVWQEGEWFIAQCREFEIASQGHSKDEALDNLSEAISVHFDPPVATILPEVLTIEAEIEGERGVA